ncbi:hypothetical protein pdam_00006779 [Pocillopora damicornis]|uniref:C2 domain-containing protein n=1 Tax=Pocillopora damicornis TaxID=46731 RepID=A0A3M6UVZ3_POCDA|nr:hypothetical protein pdam_00006779 [Pocillopora damicornis]
MTAYVNLDSEAQLTSMLKVVVNNASNLPNVDKFSGKSDPYVIVSFQGQEQRTDVIKDNLNPEWNKEFEYDLNGKELSAQETLLFKVKDWEKITANRLLGSATVPLNNLVRSKSKSVDTEVNLVDGEQRATPAKLKISLSYDPPPSATKGEAQEGGIEAGEEVKEFETTGGEPGKVGVKRTRRGQKGKALSNKPQDFQIRVKVFEARQLTGGNIHPVVRVSVADQDRDTKIKKCTNNPAFNENFSFNFHSTPMDLFEETVSFEVFDSRKYRADSLLGYFELDIYSIYDMPGHSFIRKWMLLSNPKDKGGDETEEKSAKGVRGTSRGGSPSGYLKATVTVLGPGDKPPPLSKLAGEDSSDDIEANLLRPAGVGLQDAVFTFKVYRAEDLPQMDTAVMQGVKKFFNMQQEDEKLVDPYVLFQFCGKENRTSVKYKTDCPEFKEIIKVPFMFPSMCQRVKIQMFDWDRLTDDDCIATTFLSLASMSGQGEEGFLPTFGPCWLNFYGSPREFSELPDEQEDLNDGKGEGVAYRGRLLVELETKLGEEIDKELEVMKGPELIRVQPYLSRSKYKLFACFYEASMVFDVDGPIEFEVSIADESCYFVGNYGNMMDESVAPSNTPPCNAVYDGSNYYYLPWSSEKPCVCVESYWENISFRLEPLNALLRIIDRVRSIAQDATELKEKATNVEDALSDVNGFLQRLQDLAEEPQNSLPDVILWMISGSTRIAYHRIPAYHVLFSPKEEACGKFCGKTMEIEMKYPGKKALNIADHPELPAIVRVELWFGLEQYQSNWTAREQREGDFGVLAETYENEVKIGFWTKKALTRPGFSNASGELPLPKKKFQAPEGWEFEGDWYIAPEMRSGLFLT